MIRRWHWGVVTVVCLMLAAGPARLPAQPASELFDLGGLGGKKTEKAGPHARAELIADVAAIEPGRPFRLGVRYSMDPDWHIYWLNSGDAGMPTRIDWNLPEGFKVGALQWPAPERVQYGELVTYGYHGEVVLFATVTPPAALPPASQVRLAASSDWLVCKEVCIPGDAKLELILPVGTTMPSTHVALFETMAARVPLQKNDQGYAEAYALAEWRGFDSEIRLSPAGQRTLRFEITPVAPWTIDTSASAALAPGVFPRVAEDWEATHPWRAELDAGRMVTEWPVQPRPNAAASDQPALSAVVRLPLINRQTGEWRLIALERPLDVALKSDGAATAADASDKVSSSPASMTASGAGTATSPGAKPGSNGGSLSFLETQTHQHSMFYYFLLAFLGGLVLNVMPCVLPVLSIKIMSFVRQAEEEPGRVLRLGLVYAAGVMSSFLLLALLVIALQTFFGTEVGWGFQLQEPRFVIVMSAVVLAFALWMFGVFELDLPGSVASRLTSGTARREGYAGSFFNGVLATALGTPCVGPFLGTAVGFAFTQPPLMIALLFLTVGAGLASPYVLLAANPGWVRWLPRPGAWMETVKQLMGFALLGTMVWLLAILGGQVGAGGMVPVMIFLLAVAGGCWLLGLGLDPMAGAGRRRFTLVLALVLVIAGYALFPERFMRNWTHGAAVAAQPEIQTEITASGIRWEPFSVEAVERLVAEKRTIFIDFTADWCPTCKVNEKGALASDRVAAAFNQYGVVAVKADWTSRDETIRNVLAQFGASAVPLYVILPAGRAHEPIILPSLLTPGLIEENLENAVRPVTLAKKL